MEIVKKENLKELKLSNGYFEQNIILFKKIDELEMGDALIISTSEWQGKSNLISSTQINSYFLDKNKRFTIRSLQAKKGWAIIRIDKDSVGIKGHKKAIRDLLL